MSDSTKSHRHREPIMPFEATVLNGPIHLDPPAHLPEGARVEVRLKEQPASPGEPTRTSLLKLAGTAKTLPSGRARNHDHDLHGAPKRREYRGPKQRASNGTLDTTLFGLFPASHAAT